MNAERLARLIHETYERLAPGYGWHSNRPTACAWPDLPPNNQALMVATAAEVLKVLEIEEGYGVEP